MDRADTLLKLNGDIIGCRRCPRLVAWREKVAREKTKRYAEEKYWGRPVPGFGDPEARVLLVGLAPAAHGGNRTGRVFTGDRSGDWLFRALHKAGFANQAESVGRKDGLELKDCYVSASARCAPPDNRPLPEEFENCRPFLMREIALLAGIRVVVGLGKIGFDHAFHALSEFRGLEVQARPHFGHAAEAVLAPDLVLVGCFHPSQQNTFTGKLTEEMLDGIFQRVRRLLEISPAPADTAGEASAAEASGES